MLKLLSFILRSKQRVAIIKALHKATTPSHIANETKLSKAHVSRTLREFENKGVAECKTPKEKVGRIYELTSKGKKILNHLRK